MYTRRITSDETYVLSEARKILIKEKEEKRAVLLDRIRQKAMGILSIGVAITELLAMHYEIIDDGGISIIMLPVGIWLLVIRKNII